MNEKTNDGKFLAEMGFDLNEDKDKVWAEMGFDVNSNKVGSHEKCLALYNREYAFF